MKSLRHKAILEVISEQNVDTQEKLRDLLLRKNITVNQSTLSRDIKELHLVKKTDKNGNIRYSADERSVTDIPQIFRDSVIAADYAVNTVVFKCRTGMAQGACAVFDKLEYRGVVGTLAGDDTFFVLMRTPADAEFLVKEMKDQLGFEI